MLKRLPLLMLFNPSPIFTGNDLPSPDFPMGYMAEASILDSISRWVEVICPGQEFRLEPVPNAAGEATQYRVSLAATERAEAVVSWNPRTLKGVLDCGLRLASRLGRMKEVMSMLSGKEEELRALRTLVKAPVKKHPPNPPRALAIRMAEKNGKQVLFGLGRWVPDLLDRAGGLPVLLESGDPETELDLSDVGQAGIDTLFIATSTPETPTALATEPYRSRALDVIESTRFAGSVYLVSNTLLATSSPVLYTSIFVLAAGLHPQNKVLDESRRHLTPIG